MSCRARLIAFINDNVKNVIKIITVNRILSLCETIIRFLSYFYRIYFDSAVLVMTFIMNLKYGASLCKIKLF